MICKRCGNCCHVPTVSVDHWKTAKFLTEEEKKQMLKEILKYGRFVDSCEMLICENEKYSCLGQKMFGIRGKPESCYRYYCKEKK
jgi:hypothetical protein